MISRILQNPIIVLCIQMIFQIKDNKLNNNSVKNCRFHVKIDYPFWIESESVQSARCFMVQIAHFHSQFKMYLVPFADWLLIWYLMSMLMNYCMHLCSIFVISITRLDVTVIWKRSNAMKMFINLWPLTLHTQDTLSMIIKITNLEYKCILYSISIKMRYHTGV